MAGKEGAAGEIGETLIRLLRDSVKAAGTAEKELSPRDLSTLEAKIRLTATAARAAILLRKLTGDGEDMGGSDAGEAERGRARSAELKAEIDRRLARLRTQPETRRAGDDDRSGDAGGAACGDGGLPERLRDLGGDGAASA